MKKLAFAFMLLVLSGCAGTPINWEKANTIQAGMTRQQVIDLMGEPSSVSTVSITNNEILTWVHATAFGGADSMSITFKDGKVINISKTTF